MSNIVSVEKQKPIGKAEFEPDADIFNIRYYEKPLKEHPELLGGVPIYSKEEVLSRKSVEELGLQFEPWNSESEDDNAGQLIGTYVERFCEDCLSEPFFDQKTQEYYCPICIKDE